MPSVSKSQQRLMGMVHAYKQGDLETKDLPAGLVKKIKGIAEGQKKKTGDKRKKTSGMSDKDAKDFASTKHKGLPEKVKENVITKFDKFINEGKEDKDAYDFFNTYGTVSGGASGAIEYGFIDVYIDEIKDEIQFEIEQDMNGNVKVTLRDDIEKVISILREYGVEVDEDTYEISDDNFIGAILREYQKYAD